MKPSSPVITHIEIVWSFVRSVMLKRVLHEVLPDTRIDFWRIMQGTSLDAALIEWCKVFGARKDQTHWTKLVPSEQHANFRQRLWEAVGMPEDQWDDYWSQMVDYRNERAAHHDFDSKSDTYPHFDVALEASYFYYTEFLYPKCMADHPENRFPGNMREYAGNYRRGLHEVALVATQATAEFEP
jgi:hypothetical protein